MRHVKARDIGPQCGDLCLAAGCRTAAGALRGTARSRADACAVLCAHTPGGSAVRIGGAGGRARRSRYGWTACLRAPHGVYDDDARTSCTIRELDPVQDCRTLGRLLLAAAAANCNRAWLDSVQPVATCQRGRRQPTPLGLQSHRTHPETGGRADRPVPRRLADVCCGALFPLFHGPVIRPVCFPIMLEN